MGILRAGKQGVGGLVYGLPDAALHDFLSTRYLSLNDRCPMALPKLPSPSVISRSWRTDFSFSMVKMIMQPAHMSRRLSEGSDLEKKQFLVSVRETTSLSHDTVPLKSRKDRRLQGLVL